MCDLTWSTVLYQQKSLLNRLGFPYCLLFFPPWAKPMAQRDLLLSCYIFHIISAQCPKLSPRLPLSQVLPPQSLSWTPLLCVIASWVDTDIIFTGQRNTALCSLSFIASVCLSIKYFKWGWCVFILSLFLYIQQSLPGFSSSWGFMPKRKELIINLSWNFPNGIWKTEVNWGDW